MDARRRMKEKVLCAKRKLKRNPKEKLQFELRRYRTSAGSFGLGAWSFFEALSVEL
jgi:hypothetical protein